eukprot:TRINITY_DN61557_c0_g1_i1.p1 TRINITY_DN61557_c0_g1~~TRINITY_DN61557_c0_g1_i1.p1  ORF type:complete len:352 (-),score=107.12 TRINITY_DN61557_c0_g1_i1:92-1147(-)
MAAQTLPYQEVQSAYGQALEAEHQQKLDAVAAFEWQAKESAAQAALQVRRLRQEGDSEVARITREAEEEVKRLEEERIQRLEAHSAEIQRLEEQLRHEREAADDRIKCIDQELLDLHESTDSEIQRKAAERAESLQAVRANSEARTAAADERCRQALEAQRVAKLQAQEAMAGAGKDRSLKVFEAERGCQVWVAAFNQALADTQVSLAERVEQLLAEANASRRHLEDLRERVDANWQLELAEIRQAASQERHEAAKQLENARDKSAELESSALTATQRGMKESMDVRRAHLDSLRVIASELDDVRKSLGLQARDQPLLVQGLQDMALRLRQGQRCRQPPKLSEWESQSEIS